MTQFTQLFRTLQKSKLIFQNFEAAFNGGLVEGVALISYICTYVYSFPSILSIPDPGTISIGGLLFSLTSTDILMHMSRSELAK